MNSWCRCLGILLLPAGLAGCLLTTEKYQQTRFFDLGEPEAMAADLGVGEVAVTGPYRYKMVYRTEARELVVDEYHQWAQVPSALLTRYLRRSFTPVNCPPRYRLNMEVLVFEGNLASREAVFEVDFSLRDTADRDRTVVSARRRYAAPWEADAGQFAAAMTAAVAKFAQELRNELPR